MFSKNIFTGLGYGLFWIKKIVDGLHPENISEFT